MKTIYTTFVFSFFLLAQPIVGAKGISLNKIVAVVNNEVITEQDLDQRVARIKRELKKDGTESAEADLKLRQKVLEDLINITLQLRIAQKHHITISDKELNEVVENIAKSHRLTVEELKEVLPQQEGISFAEFRDSLREQGIINRLHQQLFAKEVVATSKEIDDLLRNPPKMGDAPTEYHLIDIIIEDKEGANKDVKSQAAKDLAKTLAAKLSSKTEIEEVIKESQVGFKGSIKKEDLAWRKLDELPEIFVNTVKKMQANQVAGPIEAPNGLHLLKLEAIKKAKAVFAKLTKQQAAEIIIRRKLEKKAVPWLKELRDTAYVKIIK
jgi:peptidyl-prolyl cis-trans isomerase SurA